MGPPCGKKVGPSSKRKEADRVEWPGVEHGKTTKTIEVHIADARLTKFPADHPRPGHQDMVMRDQWRGRREEGAQNNDPPGRVAGSSLARRPRVNEAQELLVVKCQPWRLPRR